MKIIGELYLPMKKITLREMRFRKRLSTLNLISSFWIKLIIYHQHTPRLDNIEFEVDLNLI